VVFVFIDGTTRTMSNDSFFSCLLVESKATDCSSPLLGTIKLKQTVGHNIVQF